MLHGWNAWLTPGHQIIRYHTCIYYYESSDSSEKKQNAIYWYRSSRNSPSDYSILYRQPCSIWYLRDSKDNAESGKNPVCHGVKDGGRGGGGMYISWMHAERQSQKHCTHGNGKQLRSAVENAMGMERTNSGDNGNMWEDGQSLLPYLHIKCYHQDRAVFSGTWI